jgi:hypothetical protein
MAYAVVGGRLFVEEDGTIASVLPSNDER